MSTRLSVNINKIATLRNARGEDAPNLLKVATDCELMGADGITVHPRPDERHIRRDDVYSLRPILSTEFNIEGYPSPSFIELVLDVKPEQVTLVPDTPESITSNTGWNVIDNIAFLADIITIFKQAHIRTSIFVNPEPTQIKAAAFVGADRIELYTKPYAQIFQADPDRAIAPYIAASETAHNEGLGVNAGHDLNLSNLKFFHNRLPYLDEVSIGHALICDALYLGLAQTIKQYKQALV